MELFTVGYEGRTLSQLVRLLQANGVTPWWTSGNDPLRASGRRTRLEVLLALAGVDRVCILCYEGDPAACHRAIIAEEATRLEPALTVRHL